MKMINNNKGQLSTPVLIAILIVVVGVVLVSLAASGALQEFLGTLSGAGGVAVSLTPEVEGCDAPLKSYEITGELIVVQGTRNFFIPTIEPEFEEVTVLNFRNVGRELAFFSDEINYEVELYDNTKGRTAGALDTFRTSGKLGVAEAGVAVPYVLNFRLPDNNCNDIIDEFSGLIVASLETEEGDTDTFEKIIKVENGVLVVK